MDSKREDGPGLAQAREARVLRVITVALGQRRPVNRFAAGQNGLGRPIVERHEALEEVVGTFRGPGVVQRRQTIAVATYDVEDHGRGAEPDVERRTDGVRHLGQPMAIGQARATSSIMERRAVIESRRGRLATSAIYAHPPSTTTANGLGNERCA